MQVCVFFMQINIVMVVLENFCLSSATKFDRLQNTRASYNGNTPASQAGAVGSIPIARSSFLH